jgi:hypothetical protein
VESAKKALETDLSMLEKAVNSRLVEESARMKLTELLEGGAADERRTPGAGTGDAGRDDEGDRDGEGDDES